MQTVVAIRLDCEEDCSRLEAKAKGRLMPKTIQEHLDEVKRDIKLYEKFDEAEKARFNNESLLWTAQDRIEWQETQRSNAEYLRELYEKHAALLKKIGSDRLP